MVSEDAWLTQGGMSSLLFAGTLKECLSYVERQMTPIMSGRMTESESEAAAYLKAALG
jgi:hypothetical protein